jgi:exodeoxyribonuclease VII small subunit
VPAKRNVFNFEKSLAELQTLVEQMETGELSLEDSVKQFERGVALTKACHKALSDAEQKVQILMNDGESLDDFDPEQPPDA